jgi:hypothetical protein
MAADVWPPTSAMPLTPGATARGSYARHACVIVITLMLMLSCQGRSEKRKLRSGPVATLIGEIQLAADARLPAYTPLDLARRPLRQSVMAEPPSECAQANQSARTPVTVTPEGRLRGIVIAASDFTRVRERKQKQHRVKIEHCRLQPSIITAQGGDIMKLENHDAYGFEPLLGPAYEGQALKRGKTLELPMIASGIDTMQCSIGAPCGRTDVLVFHHPVHTVSDDSGQFRIDNFPAGELVRVTAWHPLFEPTETFVWLDPGQQSSIKLQLTPKARFVATQP